MVSIRITVDDKEVRQALTRLDAAGRDLKPAMSAIGSYLETATREHFQSGQAPDGAAWKPSIRALVTGGKTLFDTGRLAQSVVSEATDRAVEVGTNVIYAAIHQFGGTIRGKAGKLKFRLANGQFVTKDAVTIPARPFLGVSSEDEVEIREILADFLKGAAPIEGRP